ncbi:MAG: arsenate reductase ArsC [Terriglobales bacterium]
MSKQRVLILCTGNPARSQMAEGFLRHLAGDHFEVFSAGMKPAGLNPNVVKAMRERLRESFEDPAAAPADQQLAVFRKVRDQIRAWLEEFIGNES